MHPMVVYQIFDIDCFDVINVGNIMVSGWCDDEDFQFWIWSKSRTRNVRFLLGSDDGRRSRKYSLWWNGELIYWFKAEVDSSFFPSESHLPQLKTAWLVHQHSDYALPSSKMIRWIRIVGCNREHSSATIIFPIANSFFCHHRLFQLILSAHRQRCSTTLIPILVLECAL